MCPQVLPLPMTMIGFAHIIRCCSRLICNTDRFVDDATDYCQVQYEQHVYPGVLHLTYCRALCGPSILLTGARVPSCDRIVWRCDCPRCLGRRLRQTIERSLTDVNQYTHMINVDTLIPRARALCFAEGTDSQTPKRPQRGRSNLRRMC